VLRRATRTLITLTAAAVMATGLAVATPAAAGAAAPAPATLQQVGVQLHALWSENTPGDVTRQLDLLQQMRATSFRVDVAWSSLMTDGRGIINSSYRSRLDALVAGAQTRGLRPVLTIIETPCWASSAPEATKLGCTGAYWDRGVTKYAPASTADFAAAASWVAARYGSRIAALELWNEPNYVEEGVSPLVAPDRASTYAAMVKAAYPAVKRVAPALPVLAGALSFADDVFLKALYARGMRGSYDGISVHPYNEWRAPGAAHDIRYYKYDFVQGLTKVHEVMLAAGDRTPVWITEMGYTTCARGADKWCVTPEQQGTYLAAAVRRAAAWPWVAGFFAYNLRDKGSSPSSTEDNFGLVTRNYAPKPGVAALGAAFAAVRTTAPVATRLQQAPAVATRALGPWKRSG
jgi:hypothetical protein